MPLGNTTVTAAKAGLGFTPQLTNPMQVTGIKTFGIDFTANEPWTGGGGSVAMLTPYQFELLLGFATRFTAQAYDGSGNPVAFNPTWSVSGGGVIDSNGVFQAQSPGGAFRVTAQDGASAATAHAPSGTSVLAIQTPAPRQADLSDQLRPGICPRRSEEIRPPESGEDQQLGRDGSKPPADDQSGAACDPTKVLQARLAWPLLRVRWQVAGPVRSLNPFDQALRTSRWAGEPPASSRGP